MLSVIPSFATALTRNTLPTLTDLGGDHSKTVLASITANFVQAIPTSGSLTSSTTVSSIKDRGHDKGALVTLQTTLKKDETIYAIITNSLMARADGGCGQLGNNIAFSVTPKRPPDNSKLLTTRPDQAILYRLLGDHNPLHIDPKAAKRAGFDQPILHGLCTYGIANRGLYETTEHQFNTVEARFSAPVYPGETLRLDIWQEAAATHFELYAHERNICVMSHGKAK